MVILRWNLWSYEMTNEPIAWILKTGHGTKIVEKKPYCEVDYWKPLYTQPTKTLKTDEEILKEARESADYWMNHFDRHSKADMEILYRHVADKFRAILRKA